MDFHRLPLLFLVFFTIVVVSIRFSLKQPAFKMPLSSDFQNRKCQNLSGILSCNILHTQFNADKMQITSSNIKKQYLTRNVTRETFLSRINCAMLLKHSNNTKVSGKFIPEDLISLNNTLDYCACICIHETMRTYLPVHHLLSSVIKGPFNFLKMYKSPCWTVANTNRFMPTIRCLPYFYLIGAPKCGTTDLHRRLILHPQISYRPTKEPHWLCRKQYNGQPKLTDYLAFFTTAAREAYTKKDSNGFHNMIFGDCSPSTMWDNDYWPRIPKFENLSEPLYTNADYIHHLNPKAKIIAILRNPVDRMYSDYLYFNHGNPETFHTSVLHIINITNECLKTNSLRQCLYTPTSCMPKVETNRLRIGVYHLHLREYLRVFPRDQVMVLKLEHFSNNTISGIRKIFSFLQISPLKIKDLQIIANPARRANHRKMKDEAVGKMLPKTQKLLEEFYNPHNELLSELLGEQFNYNKDFG